MLFADTRTAPTSSLSSLVRALELSGQDSGQGSSRSNHARSRNLPPPATRSSPTSHTRFSSFASNRRELPPTRESLPVSRFAPQQQSPSRFQRQEDETPAPQSPPRPVATANSELRFGQNRPRPSKRITFIPDDRGERFNRPLLPHHAAALASKSSRRPPPRTTTRAPTTKPPVTEAPSNPYEYVYVDDDYYYDYYYEDTVPANDSEKRENQPEDLGPIDPPMTKGPLEATTPRSTQPKTPATSTPKLRFTSSPSKATGAPPRKSGGSSLSALLAALPRNNEGVKSTQQSPQKEKPSKQPVTETPVEETTDGSRFEVRVTNTTESTFVVANIQTSRSMSMRQEGTVENTTPLIQNEASSGDTLSKKERKLESDPIPSLESLFGSLNESETEDNISTTVFSSPDSTTKVVDITTEMQKLATTEKNKLSAILDKIFEKPQTIDPSKFPPGFSTTSKSISSSVSSTSERHSTTPRKSTTEASGPSNTSSSSLSKDELLFAALFGNTASTTISPALLPPGFNSPENKESKSSSSSKFNVPVGKTNNIPKGFNTPEISGANIPAHLLPKDYKTKEISGDDIPAHLLPKGFKTKEVTGDEIPSHLLPKGFKTKELSGDEIPSHLLPKGFETKEVSGSEIPSHLLPEGFNTKEVAGDDIPAHLLPKGFKTKEVEGDEIPAHLLPKGFKPKEVTGDSIPAHLLPKGFKPQGSSGPSPEKSTTTDTKTTTPAPTRRLPNGLIFPKKVNRPSYLTTTTTERSLPSGPPPFKPAIENIFER